AHLRTEETMIVPVLGGRRPFGRKRLALVAVLAAAGALAGLLASGLLSKSTHGTGSAIPTTAPLITTSGGSQQPNPPEATTFGPGDWGMYGNTPDEIRHSPLTEITKQNLNELGRVFTI